MFELLNPRRVAARKIARQIAQRGPSGPPEARAAERPIREETSNPFDVLLEEELKRYGISMG